MKPVLALVILGAIALTGCTETEKRTTTGAAIGAAAGGVIGAATTGTAGGTLAGAAIGAGTGAFIAYATRPGYCIYRDRYGRRYEARCRH